MLHRISQQPYSNSLKVRASQPKIEEIATCLACGGTGNTQLQTFRHGRPRLEKIDCLICKGQGYTVNKIG